MNEDLSTYGPANKIRVFPINYSMKLATKTTYTLLLSQVPP